MYIEKIKIVLKKTNIFSFKFSSMVNLTKNKSKVNIVIIGNWLASGDPILWDTAR